MLFDSIRWHRNMVRKKLKLPFSPCGQVGVGDEIFTPWWVKVMEDRWTDEWSSQQGTWDNKLSFTIQLCLVSFFFFLKHPKNFLRIDNRLLKSFFQHSCSLFRVQTTQHARWLIKLSKRQLQYDMGPRLNWTGHYRSIEYHYRNIFTYKKFS